MKFRISNKYGQYWQEFDSFDSAWDFIEKFIPKEIHQDLYVIGDL